MLIRALVAAAVLLPSAALADKIGGASEMELGELPLRAEAEHLTLVTVREAAAPLPEDAGATSAAPEQDVVEGAAAEPAASGDAGEGASDAPSAPIEETAATAPPGSLLDGTSPWRYFDGAFPESSCTDPRMSADAFAALAVCAGLDKRDPRARHVVIRRGYAIFRYPIPVYAGAVADLSADGNRFAVLTDENGARILHLVDMVERMDHRVAGGWREPGNPVVAGEANAVAFTAQVGGKEGAVLAHVGGDEPGAWRAWRGGRSVDVLGITANGDRVLVRAKEVDLAALFLVDPRRQTRFDLSGRKGDVRDADLHPSGDNAVFSSSVGGVCAVWWVDLTTRRRKDLLTSVDGCYERVRMDTSRRLVMYEEASRNVRPTFVYDRKSRDVRMQVPVGCTDTELTRSGAFLATRCTRDQRGAGLFIVAVPEEK